MSSGKRLQLTFDFWAEQHGGEEDEEEEEE